MSAERYHDQNCPADRRYPRWAEPNCICKGQQHLNQSTTLDCADLRRRAEVLRGAKQLEPGWTQVLALLDLAKRLEAALDSRHKEVHPMNIAACDACQALAAAKEAKL